MSNKGPAPAVLGGRDDKRPRTVVRETVPLYNPWHGAPGAPAPDMPTRILMTGVRAGYGGTQSGVRNIIEHFDPDEFHVRIIVAGDHIGAPELEKWAEVVHFPEEQPKGLCRDLSFNEWVRRFVRGQIWSYRPHLIWCWSGNDLEECEASGIPTLTRVRALNGLMPEEIPPGVACYRVSEECPGDWPVITPGVRVTPPPYEPDRQPNHVVRIGRADPDRNPAAFADALVYLQDEIESGEVIVSIIGEPFYGDWNWRKELDRRGLYEPLVWGHLPHERAMAVMDTAAVHVANCPESFGQATAEAMMRGAIPVVSREGYGPTMVGETGVTVRESPADIARGIRTALKRSQSVFNRNAARQRAIEHYDAADSAKRNINLIRALTTFPRVDIVLPVHNHRAVTEKCINSILGNTHYANWRLIVVNDDSEDDTASYLTKLQRYLPAGKLRIVRAHNRNGIKSLWSGLELADAPYVMVLNNDMLMPPSWLERLLSDLVAHEDVGVMIPTLSDETKTEAQIAQRVHVGRGNRSVGLWRREALRRPCETLMELQSGADNDMIARMCRDGWRTAMHYGVELYHVGSLCRQHLPHEQLARGVEELVAARADEGVLQLEAHV